MTLEELIEKSRLWGHNDIEIVVVIYGKEFNINNAVATQTKLYLKAEESNEIHIH